MGKFIWKSQDLIDNEKIYAARKSKILELKEKCTASIYEGFHSSSTGHSFGFNELDQQNFTQQAVMIIAANGNYTDPIQWKTKEGTIETLSVQQFTQLMIEAKNHKETEQRKYWALELEVYTSMTVEEIEAISWN